MNTSESACSFKSIYGVFNIQKGICQEKILVLLQLKNQLFKFWWLNNLINEKLGEKSIQFVNWILVYYVL